MCAAGRQRQLPLQALVAGRLQSHTCLPPPACPLPLHSGVQCSGGARLPHAERCACRGLPPLPVQPPVPAHARRCGGGRGLGRGRVHGAGAGAGSAHFSLVSCAVQRRGRLPPSCPCRHALPLPTCLMIKQVPPQSPSSHAGPMAPSCGRGRATKTLTQVGRGRWACSAGGWRAGSLPCVHGRAWAQRGAQPRPLRAPLVTEAKRCCGWAPHPTNHHVRGMGSANKYTGTAPSLQTAWACWLTWTAAPMQRSWRRSWGRGRAATHRVRPQDCLHSLLAQPACIACLHRLG